MWEFLAFSFFLLFSIIDCEVFRSSDSIEILPRHCFKEFVFECYAWRIERRKREANARDHSWFLSSSCGSFSAHRSRTWIIYWMKHKNGKRKKKREIRLGFFSFCDNIEHVLFVSPLFLSIFSSQCFTITLFSPLDRAPWSLTTLFEVASNIISTSETISVHNMHLKISNPWT